MKDAQFEDALIFKLFVVQFLNSYATLYYVAFFKGPLEGCWNSHCVSDLSYRLVGLLVSRFIYVAFYNFALPRITVLLRRSRALMSARQIGRWVGDLVESSFDSIPFRSIYIHSYSVIQITRETPLPTYRCI